MHRPGPRLTRFAQSLRALFKKPAVTYGVLLAGFLAIYPLQAHASPFDTGFNNLQTLFTGTIAKVASIIAIVLGGIGFATGEPGAKKNLAGVAIVLGGIGFATGEPGAKKNLAGVAIGIGIATLAVNILSWLWGS